MSNNKQLAKNGIYNIIQFIINFCISFFFTPYLIRTIGKEAYSFFPLVNNMIGYTSIITTAIGGMAGRFITMRIFNNDIEGASFYFNSVLVANWILSVFFTIIAVIVVVYLPCLLTIPQELVYEVKLLFAFACASMILGLASGILSTGTFVKNRVDASASRGIITNVVRVCLILVLFALFRPSIVFMSVSAFGAALLSMYYNIKFKKKFLPEIPINPFRYFRISYIKELVSSSIWNSINQLSFLLLTQLDLFITNIFIGVSETGDYSIAKMMPTLIQSFFGVLVGAFLPQFTILFAKGETHDLIKEINKSIKIMGIASSILIGFLIVYGNEFFILWIPGQISDKLNILSILTLIPMIISGCINSLFHVFTVTNKLKIPSIVLLANGIVNTLLVFVLLKFTSLGVLAIPISSMLTLIIKNVTFTPMYAAYCLNQNLRVFYKDIVIGCCSCFIVVAVSFLIKETIPSSSWTTLIFSAILVSIISLIFSYFLFLDKEERFFLNTIVMKKLRHE